MKEERLGPLSSRKFEFRSVDSDSDLTLDEWTLAACADDDDLKMSVFAPYVAGTFKGKRVIRIDSPEKELAFAHDPSNSFVVVMRGERSTMRFNKVLLGGKFAFSVAYPDDLPRKGIARFSQTMDGYIRLDFPFIHLHAVELKEAANG